MSRVKPAKSQLEKKLFAAIEKKDVRAVQALIQEGVKVDCRNGDGDSPLLRSVIKQSKRIVEQLVSAGADVNGRCDEGALPLIRAVIGQDETIVKLLLDAGADIDATDGYGESAMHAAAGSSFSVVKEKTKSMLGIIRLLIESGAELSSTESADPPIHIAARHASASIVELLLEAGAGVGAIDYVDANGWTPLLGSLHSGRLENAVLLVRYGASLKQSTIRGNALELAASRNAQWVGVLEKAAAQPRLKPRTTTSATRPKVKKVDLRRVLMKAIEGNDVPELKKLLREGVPCNEPIGSAGLPLCLAAARGHLGIVNALVEAGADVNAWDRDESPLHAAAAAGQAKVIRYLVKSGAEIDASGTYGTPCTPPQCTAMRTAQRHCSPSAPLPTSQTTMTAIIRYILPCLVATCRSFACCSSTARSLAPNPRAPSLPWSWRSDASSRRLQRY